MRILLLAEQERLVAARFPLEAEAVEEAGLRHLRDLLGALLLLHSGPMEAAAAALVEDLAVDLVSAPESFFFSVTFAPPYQLNGIQNNDTQHNN
jgi:hypothetical protein